MLYSEDNQWYRPAEIRRGDSTYEADDKGHYNGSCNRSCCQAPRLATWYNQSTQRYYCFACGVMLNSVNNYPNELASLPLDKTRLCIPPSDPKHPNFAELRYLPEQVAFDRLCIENVEVPSMIFNRYHANKNAFVEYLLGEMVYRNRRAHGSPIPTERVAAEPCFRTPMFPETLPEYSEFKAWLEAFYYFLPQPPPSDIRI